MNKKYLLSALMGVAAVAFTGCIEENFEKVTPAQDGDEIIFGARAGFENSNPSTRTEYSGETYTVGEGTDAKTFERIYWVDGTDMIQIYCPEATNGGEGNTAHYRINDAKKDEAFLTGIGDSSLQWNGDNTHNFYAMYPSSNMFITETTLAQGVKMNGTTLQGTIPNAQTPIRVETVEGNLIAVPDMKYAYMAAKGTATREDGGVSLTFVPVVTAVQIQLTLADGEYNPIEIGEISVEGVGISGNFMADLSAWQNNPTLEDYSAYPACENIGAGENVIQITVLDKETFEPLILNPGKSLTFTVFLRPGQDYTNLKVSISPTGAGYISKTIGGVDNPLSIPKNLKTKFTNLKLPATSSEVVFDASNWMESINDNTIFKKLSLPGTSGSFSYKYIDDKTGNFRSQHTTMDIDAQWQAGIRAFEIVSDRKEINLGFVSWATSLADAQVTCNKVDMGITVADAMKEIKTKVEENPKECAVVIFTYQPKGASPARNATRYAQSLELWYDGIDYQEMFKLYTPEMTLEKARGHILVFVRPNQLDEKDGGSFDGILETENFSSYPFIWINGCGTGKDKWGARGYNIDDKRAPDISNSSDVYIEQYMQDNTLDLTAQDSKVKLGSLRFNYSTSNSSIICWFQEWSRVISADKYVPAGTWTDPVYGFSVSYPDIYWFESYEEKLSNAIRTFDMAVSNEYDNYIFINSLSGYLAETAESPSYSLVPSVGSAYGGDGGNIKDLADKLNPAFYEYVFKAGMDQTTGPTGIVMMDYVSDTPNEEIEFDGSYRLPGLIISNNRKFAAGN